MTYTKVSKKLQIAVFWVYSFLRLISDKINFIFFCNQNLKCFLNKQRHFETVWDNMKKYCETERLISL